MSTNRVQKMKAMTPKTVGFGASERVNKTREPQHSTDVESWLQNIECSMIRKRAEEIFFQQGSQPGRDLNNWLQAEAEVKKHLEEVELTLRATSRKTIAQNGNN